MAQLTCPECDAVFKPKTPVEEGKKVRCPECDHRFVPDDNEKGDRGEDDDRPSCKTGKSKDKGSGNLLLFGLLGGGAVVLLLGCCGCGALAFFLWPEGGLFGSSVELNAAQVNRLDMGMNIAETEKFMGGKGRRVEHAEVIATINRIQRIGKPVTNLPGDTHIRYRNGDRHMFLGFGNTRSGELLTYAYFIEEVGNGSNSNSRIVFGANLEAEREKFLAKKNQAK